MRIEDAKTLTPIQRERIANLAAIADGGNLRIEISDDESKVVMKSGRTGKIVCTSPLTDFSD